MAQQPELLTAVQAGQILGKSSSTVRRMAESGDLDFVQKLPGPNGAFLFRRSVIEQYKRANPARIARWNPAARRAKAQSAQAAEVESA